MENRIYDDQPTGIVRSEYLPVALDKLYLRIDKQKPLSRGQGDESFRFYISMWD